MTIDEYKRLLESRLTAERYRHSLCVADEARRLAKIYGFDADKMYLAGLLHDVTKNTSETEQLKLLSDSGIILSDIEKASPAVWHAMSGAAFIRDKLGITDDDIVSAVRYHTTGKSNMTLPQKIIYIADLTSADRAYPDVEEIRSTVDRDLDRAIFKVLTFTIKNLASKRRIIHPDTLGAYNYMLLDKSVL